MRRHAPRSQPRRSGLAAALAGIGLVWSSASGCGSDPTDGDRVQLPVFEQRLPEVDAPVTAEAIDAPLLQVPIDGESVAVREGARPDPAYRLSAVSREDRTRLEFVFPGGEEASIDYALVDGFPVPVRIRAPDGVERVLILEGEDEGFLNVIPFRYPVE